jgi:hypothetical protein
MRVPDATVPPSSSGATGGMAVPWVCAGAAVVPAVAVAGCDAAAGVAAAA